jgi:oxygen-independent coproporphyrinogen-3 oxidase
VPDADDAPDRPITAVNLRGTTALGVYVHVPWCATRCTYCDFNTYTSAAGRGDYAAAAAAEVRWQARTLLGARRRPVDTVFIGGGTPTLLEPEALSAVVRAVDAELGLAPDAELTVEANPDSVGPASLERLREAGFTRVSLGMQSATPHVLRLLGRTHAPGRPPAAAREARAAGFEHVSLDLIYGTPGETADDWRRTLDAALAAGPDHVSTYGLTVEPGTKLAADVRRGRTPMPDGDTMADRYLTAEALLTAAGLPWYEVASWAASEAARCRHNEGYWRSADWLAIGPGAHGHLDGTRWWNARHPTDWARRALAGTGAVDGREELSAEQRRLERLMVALRLREGLAAADADPAAIDGVVADGLAERRGDRLVLTLDGRLIADHVTRRLAAGAPLAVA